MVPSIIDVRGYNRDFCVLGVCIEPIYLLSNILHICTRVVGFNCS